MLANTELGFVCLQGTTEVVRDVTEHGKLLSQNVDLRTQLRATELERNMFKNENEKVGAHAQLPGRLQI